MKTMLKQLLVLILMGVFLVSCGGPKHPIPGVFYGTQKEESIILTVEQWNEYRQLFGISQIKPGMFSGLGLDTEGSNDEKTRLFFNQPRLENDVRTAYLSYIKDGRPGIDFEEEKKINKKKMYFFTQKDGENTWKVVQIPRDGFMLELEFLMIYEGKPTRVTDEAILSLLKEIKFGKYEAYESYGENIVERSTTETTTK